MFKVNNKYTRTTSGVITVNVEHISHLFLVFFIYLVFFARVWYEIIEDIKRTVNTIDKKDRGTLTLSAIVMFYFHNSVLRIRKFKYNKIVGH